MTRTEKSRALGGWMQAVLSSDEDLFAEVLRRGVEALMEAERDAYVSAAPFERGAHRQTQRNGYKARTLVTRVGPFNAVSGGQFLNYLPSQQQLAIMPRQPGADFQGPAKWLEAAREGHVETALDPTRGVLLSIYAQRPNFMERIEKGEAVGYVILRVGFIGGSDDHSGRPGWSASRWKWSRSRMSERRDSASNPSPAWTRAACNWSIR